MQDLGLVVEMVETRFAKKEEEKSRFGEKEIDEVQLCEEEKEVFQFREVGEVVVRAAAELVVVRFQR